MDRAPHWYCVNCDHDETGAVNRMDDDYAREADARFEREAEERREVAHARDARVDADDAAPSRGTF